MGLLLLVILFVLFVLAYIVIRGIIRYIAVIYICTKGTYKGKKVPSLTRIAFLLPISIVLVALIVMIIQAIIQLNF